MSISFTDSYNALGPFEWTDIPPFVVILGKNGVGKTQLLNLFSSSVNKYDNRGSGAPITASIIVTPNTPQKALYAADWNISEPQAIGDSEKEQIMNQYIEQYKHYLRGQFNGVLGKKEAEYKHFSEMGLDVNSSPDEFKKYISEKFYLDEENLLTYRLGFVFREYNAKRGVAALILLDDSSISRDEINVKFQEQNGEAPWDVFNKMMKIAGLSFSVKAPKTFDKESIHLYDSQERIIEWRNLSSGEKVLIQLACWLLYKTFSSEAFPTLLLLDEPDASLHPAMIHNLLSVLNDSIVKELGIRVIITTHSPTTVALAPASSLFELKKNPTDIASISKEDAIQILSDGLIMVGVNTRYVFVEGKSDPDFYERQYTSDVRRRTLGKYPSLAFTPVSTGNPGGVEELKKTISRLNATPLGDRVRGVIDLDGGNEETDNINVLSRYAIENYIFDPLIIALSLVHQGNHGIIESLRHLQAGDSISLLKDSNLVQLAVNEICKIISDNKHGEIHLDKELAQTRIIFGNGEELEYLIPKWYVMTSKDNLRSKLLYSQTSPLRDLIQKNDCLLVMDVTSLVFDDMHQIFNRLKS